MTYDSTRKSHKCSNNRYHYSIRPNLIRICFRYVIVSYFLSVVLVAHDLREESTLVRKKVWKSAEDVQTIKMRYQEKTYNVFTKLLDESTFTMDKGYHNKNKNNAQFMPYLKYNIRKAFPYTNNSSHIESIYNCFQTVILRTFKANDLSEPTIFRKSTIAFHVMGILSTLAEFLEEFEFFNNATCDAVFEAHSKEVASLKNGSFWERKRDKREISKTPLNEISMEFSKSSNESRLETGSVLQERQNAVFVRDNQTVPNVFYERFETNLDSPVSMYTQGRQGKKNVIYMHGLFEQSGKDCRLQPEAGPYELLAAKLAIEHINERNIIPGYKLEMYDNDTRCDSGVAVDSFFHYLYRLPTMLMMLGTGSSEVTERLARVVSRWNIIQVSYGASSPALSDRKNFPFFFRTVAPDSSHNTALLAFIQHHGWDTVATLHEQGDNHALPMTKLVTELEQANISVSLTKGVSERDYKEHLLELKARDCRIFVASFSLFLVKKIFCYVYELEMFGADYAWILQGDLKVPWWTDPRGTDCSKNQLAQASLGVIVVGSHYGLDGNTTSVSGNTIDDVLKSIGFETDSANSGFVSQTYDAAWAMALALREIQSTWLEEQRNLSLNDFSYEDYSTAEEIAAVLSRLKFLGVSGPVSFYNSDRVGITSFHQNQGKDGELSLVCLHYPHSDELNFACGECTDIVWQGSRVPIARRIIRLRIAVLDRGVLICITSLAAFGVILALTFLSFNLYFRRLKFIKLSSPNLNNFVVVGCVLVYVAMILLGMDHGSLSSDDHFGFICSARAFLLSGGFSLAFGCMFIKTYRVYHIFIRSNSGIVKSKLLHDKQLLGMVSGLVLVDCFLVTLWVTLDPMERQLRNLTMQVNPLERNLVYLYQREQCYSLHMAKWLGSLYIYKGLLLVVGCYMAWETRHVKIPALNDSQYIGMSVYNVVITSVIVVALANVIPVERYTLTFVLVSTLIFVSTTMTLCLLFLPKIHTIFTNPGDGSAVVATPGVKVEFRTRRFALDEPKESIYRAEVLNRALKRELLELEEEITRLSEKMGIIPPDLHKSKPENKQQDEDSDDDLPPWFDEYKKYPSNGSSGIWYTGGRDRPGACFSVLSAMHPLLMSTAECSTSQSDEHENEAQPPKVVIDSTYQACEKTRADVMRSSLPSMTLVDCHTQKTRLAPLDQCQMSLSERALNRIKHPQKYLQTQATVPQLTKLTSNNVLKSKQYSKSATRLMNGWSSTEKDQPTGSLPKISTVDRCFSITSVSTLSCDSEWATAPLYSSSFATAMDSAGCSSNKTTTATPCETPDPHAMPRDSLTDSSNGFFTSEESSVNNGPVEVCVISMPDCDSHLPIDTSDFTHVNPSTLHDTLAPDTNISEAEPLMASEIEKESDYDNNLLTISEVSTLIDRIDEPENQCTEMEETETIFAELSLKSCSLEDNATCEEATDSGQYLHSELSCSSSGAKSSIFADEMVNENETTCLLERTDSPFANQNVKLISVTETKTPSIETYQSETSSEETPNSNCNNNVMIPNSNQNSEENDNNSKTEADHRLESPTNASVNRGDIRYQQTGIPNQQAHQIYGPSGRLLSQEQELTHYENLRQLFQIERDLILLELERSESVDL